MVVLSFYTQSTHTMRLLVHIPDACMEGDKKLIEREIARRGRGSAGNRDSIPLQKCKRGVRSMQSSRPCGSIAVSAGTMSGCEEVQR